MVSIYTNLFVTVEHLTPDIANANKLGFVTDVGLLNIAANIQPSTPEMTALYGGAYGKTYTMFTTASGILEGDRLTVSGTNEEFIVKGKQNFDYGYGKHIELILEKNLP